MFLKKDNKKALIREQFPQSRAKTRETALCQTTLVAIFLVSININLIMKVMKKFK